MNVLNNKCNPGDLNSCQINEKCEFNESPNEFECNCKSDKYRRINSKCYEYLSNTQSCEINTNECRKPFEVCISSLNDFSKFGTCQCDLLYERDSDGYCILKTSDQSTSFVCVIDYS